MYISEEEKSSIKRNLNIAIKTANKNQKSSYLEIATGAALGALTTYSIIETTLRNEVFASQNIFIGTCFLAGSSVFFITDGIKTYKKSKENSKILKKELSKIK